MYEKSECILIFYWVCVVMYERHYYYDKYVKLTRKWKNKNWLNVRKVRRMSQGREKDFSREKILKV